MSKPLADKIALVTGSSRGIGAATALALANAGAHCVLAARTVGGLEATDDAIKAVGGSASIVPIDLAKHELIDALAANIFERWGRLDILVGNAAILGELTPLAHANPKIWQSVMDINVTANYRLIRAMDPLFKQADSAQAVFVTSGVVRAATPYWGPYAASKAALEHLVCTYGEEVRDSHIGVSLFDPGVVRTAMRKQAFPGEQTDQLADPIDVAGKICDNIVVGFATHSRRKASA